MVNSFIRFVSIFTVFLDVATIRFVKRPTPISLIPFPVDRERDDTLIKRHESIAESTSEMSTGKCRREGKAKLRVNKLPFEVFILFGSLRFKAALEMIF